MRTEADKVREALFSDSFVSNEDYGRLVEEAAQADDYREFQLEGEDMSDEETETDEIITTETDAVLDTKTALEMYAGGFGSEETTIYSVEETNGNSLLVTLSNDDQFLIRVSAL